MAKLNVIPYPNKVDFLGGTRTLSDVDIDTAPVIFDDGLNEEGYILNIADDSISITAGSPKGAFYARQTLLQLGNAGECPLVRIEDTPAYEYRAFMVDCARHMTSVEDLKKLIDAAALTKMNAMHWHLTDDQGWRIEIDRHPELVEIGSHRKSSNFGQYHFNEEYSGHFTKAEIRDVVAYARDRFIEVIPEVDLPGHTMAILAAHPELSCTGEHIEVGTKQGIFSDILCAGNDDVFKLIYDVIDELCELFDSKYFHIGGDEAPKDHWKSCSKCQQRIKEQNLKDEEELQGWFVLQVMEYLKTKGKTAVVWNESLNSGMMPTDCVVQYWMGNQKLPTDFANNGGKLVISDFYHYYCDYPYGMTPLKKTYGYSPAMKELTDEGKKNVRGVECPLWAEYVRDFDKFCYMTFPRFPAVAETGWTDDENKDYKSFVERFDNLREMLAAIGITPAPEKAWNPNPLKRLAEIAHFFKGTFSLETVLNSIKTTNS